MGLLSGVSSGVRAGVTVERVIASEPGPIFDLLADPSRHREIDGSGSVRDAVEGSTRVALGTRFGMDMHIGLGYGMVNEVVEFEEDRRIAWQARPTSGIGKRLAGGRIWRYELEPVEGGTLVRESWDISQEVFPLLVQYLRGATKTNITKTLARIDQIVTAEATD